MHFFHILFVVATLFLEEIFGHGMLLEPPNRSALWKFYPVDNHRVVPNYDLTGIFCGGYSMQWDRFKGKCGVCGDPYNAPHPQPNENTGKHGKYGPVRSYGSGSVINVKVQLTANHRGKFRYSLCVLDDPSKPESGEHCFKPLKLADGREEYKIGAGERIIHNSLKLPDGLRCNRCVLRWEYIAGNNWGTCPDGRGKLGCGPQETFRNCADIKIQ
ncbi:uncharacterized protein LOC123308180 [Coccinella septempunctata]|uniref:uncharacterized protein LOC123308180 n=1 Tax=Coccinella septempunctata TaxID=41139 RepID=UPI001D07B099|nr:uncharacterized protein LOC123308180 [Coccinella septempunctata]